MLIIRCSHCKTKLIKYEKIGKGELHKCIKSRIIKNFTVKEGSIIKCPKCGNVIGVDMGNFIKLYKGSFTYSGTKIPK
jgi:phage FluMu protein Com